ncbi:hypothetical protein [Kribbella sp. NPDC055071]
MSYLPPGGTAAPNYNQPPRRNRAGLVIVVLLLVLIGVLGVGGVVGYRLISDQVDSAGKPDPTPTKPPTIKPPGTKPTVAKPTTKRTVSKPPVTKPPARKPTTPVEFAASFVAQLNANNPAVAASMACEGSEKTIPLLMQSQLVPPTNLTSGSTTTGTDEVFVISLSGTTATRSVAGVIVLNKLGKSPLCVRVFQLSSIP